MSISARGGIGRSGAGRRRRSNRRGAWSGRNEAERGQRTADSRQVERLQREIAGMGGTAEGDL